MQTIYQILKKYWNYDEFRPLQEEIIRSVLEGKDTLALLPTGGGKSICYQVPALLLEGICIVISPLIALMKDQVENLNQRGIKAVALTSDMSYREIDIALDNCIYGHTKFLYVSPERLGNDLFKARLLKMKVSFLAVDEAHCISQWGYDFRPSYLKIQELRELLPEKTALLALTATATPDVITDIQNKLSFPTYNVLSKSFNRPNLHYMVVNEENKLDRIVKICTKLNGTGLIYVRNRRLTKEIASYLFNHHISAGFYHAGLNVEMRGKIQTAWKKNELRVIVCTNAFGMGIDKPDVRFVIHYDLPDSLEAYFQEAGRAGRDEKQAYALALFSGNDTVQLQDNFKLNFPDKEEIKKAYQAICNYYKIAFGAGEGIVVDFDMMSICNAFNLSSITFYNSLKFLERDGYIILSDAHFQPSKLFINSDKTKLYDFQLKHPTYDGLIKLILRSYSGVFSDYVRINEQELAKRANIKKEIIVEQLQFLNTIGLASYVPEKNLPQLTFNQPRVDAKHLVITKESYDDRKEVAAKKIEAVIDYASNKELCRNRNLLSYLGETNTHDCGHCDVCIKKNKKIVATHKDSTRTQVINILQVEPQNLHDLIEKIVGSSDLHEENIIEILRELVDDGLITVDRELVQLAKV